MIVGISLGWDCAPAGYAVANGLRPRKSDGYKTCPFDLMNTNYKGVVECLRDDFKYFCHPDYITLKIVEKDCIFLGYRKGDILIVNTKYNFIFNHESPNHGNLHLHENWPNGPYHFCINNFKEFFIRYNRRVNNFLSYLNSGMKVAFVISKINCNAEECKDLVDVIKEKYPLLDFEMHYCEEERHGINNESEEFAFIKRDIYIKNENNLAPKTIFCDIDGTLLFHHGNIRENVDIANQNCLENVLESVAQWEKLNYKIILTTGRKESLRKLTEEQLLKFGIVYDQLIMGITNGDRILVNDKKPNGVRNTAYAVNLVRNKGLKNFNFSSSNVTIDDSFIFKKIEKPWGSEELIECNDKYVVKKLFMKEGHSCSIQYHELKTETIIVLNGRLNIYIGEKIESLDKREYISGETITIKPYTIHRMEAVEDSTYIETSTNELWDVVRLQDNYNRI